MKRPIIEWFRLLDEPYQTEAIKNLNNPSSRIKQPWEVVSSMQAALFHGFDWNKSPQGYGYWNKLHAYYQDRVIVFGDESECSKEEMKQAIFRIAEKQLKGMPIMEDQMIELLKIALSFQEFRESNKALIGKFPTKHLKKG